MQFRHEWKQEITKTDRLLLQKRLGYVLESDSHAVDGVYRIRSLYFDNLQDKALREKCSGVNVREKFRLRYYNDDTDYILLEKKSKINGLCNKVQVRLTREEAQALSTESARMDAAMLAVLEGCNKPLVRELCQKMKLQGLQPKTIIDYTRIPYTYGPGNVRVTIDYDIRTALKSTDFLNPEVVMVPVAEDPVILEIKWDAFLPEVVRQLVQIPNCRTGSYSKYEAGRVYG